MNERVAVFFRTHHWDEYVARQASALRQLSQGGHFYVLADETRGALPVEGFYKLSHNEHDFEPMGLHRYWDTHLLWYNGDYPLYKMVSAHPQYDYYVMVEYDVSTNVDLVGLAKAASAQGADAIMHNPHPVEPQWPWLESCRAYEQQPWRALISIIVISRAAIEWLFVRRRRLTERFRNGEIDRLPFCEAFVPTELLHAGMKVLDLTTFGNTDKYEFWPPTLDTRVQLPGSPTFIHPVLDEKRFVPSRLGFGTDLQDVFEPTSKLSQELAGCNPDVVGAHLLRLMRQKNDMESETRLMETFPGLRGIAS